ncbi:MAG: hypothetical protein LBT17_03230 [Mycoplasmataceae bacterium]|nr:hypothetical protein [Mycoplasmataceae bacterium]
METRIQPQPASNKVTIFRCLAISTCLLSLATFLLVTIGGLNTKVSIDGYDITLGFWTAKWQIDSQTFITNISNVAITSIALLATSCILLATTIFLTKGKNIFGKYSKTMTLTSIIVFAAAFLIFILAISNRANSGPGGWGWIFNNIDVDPYAIYTIGGIIVVIIASLSGASMLVPITVQLIKSKKK